MYDLMPVDTVWVHCLCFYSKSSASEISATKSKREGPDKTAATSERILKKMKTPKVQCKSQRVCFYIL